jgi:hypothetical protein
VVIGRQGTYIGAGGGFDLPETNGSAEEARG